MPVLHLTFNHPVKGTASLKQLGLSKSRTLNVMIDSEHSNQVEIQTGQCVPGKWLMTLNWQYDGRSFSYNRPFEVSEKSIPTIIKHQAP